MCNSNIDLLIISNCIFTGLKNVPEAGYIAVKGNEIIKVGTEDSYFKLIDEGTIVIDLKDQLVAPGFVDVHTFFTGYAISHIGIDLSGLNTKEKCMKAIVDYAETLKDGAVIFGHGWKPEPLSADGMESLINEKYPERSVILFATNRSTCIMNQTARHAYGFTPEECYPEAYYKIMREYLNERAFIEPEFQNYMKLMNSRGVTSVKEMGFDDFYGFDDFLKEKEEKKQLTLRTFFMSQPVGAKIDIGHGKRMQEKFTGDFARFSGYNRMTDGTIDSRRGDLLEPYEGTDSHCSISIDYDMIEKEVLEADANGFRFSLHAQGDGAIRKVLEIYDKCKKENGRVVNRHAITDMEFSNPKDLEHMAELGIIGEIYFQIMSLESGNDIKKTIQDTIGSERGKYYWNRRKMIESGVVLSGATDLPLMITDIPEAIYHSCGGFFPDGGEPFNEKNTITIAEILKAWTLGGQINLGMEEKLGTLEKGKIADITVLDRNVFDAPMEQMRDVTVAMTIVDGRVVYRK